MEKASEWRECGEWEMKARGINSRPARRLIGFAATGGTHDSNSLATAHL